ncbi:MAG: NUDIX domain-containing protein [Thomasclavelia ramosa]
MGKLEVNENPKDCAFRELEEETNYIVLREMKFNYESLYHLLVIQVNGYIFMKLIDV